MKGVILIMLMGMLMNHSFSQVTGLPAITEQQLEDVTENNEDIESEDDSYLQQLEQFRRNPVNLNTADVAQLKELVLLSDIQIRNLLSYRRVLGELIDIYEIQALPGWDMNLIQKIRPYVTVSDHPPLIETIGGRLRNGDQQVLLRISQVLERSAGFSLDSRTSGNFYKGSPQKIFARYKYVYKNLLQYGVTAEKDAGEQFFKGTQKAGFDFYSAHFFARNLGIIKSLAIGDYTVNLGQGLTQWMSLAFKKSGDITAIKRQASVIKPYNSAGEINFHRGIGITAGRNSWEATLFGSYRNIDANLNPPDSVYSEGEFISSLQISGYHRTGSETEDKGIQRQLIFGGNLNYRADRFQLGVNAVQYMFKYPLIKQPEPYNKYALRGKSFGNYSADYSYTWKNMHLFGEIAFTGHRYHAIVNGLLISVAGNADMSLLYRNISKGYQSLYTSAFTENTSPTNERGLFAGISVRPSAVWRIDAYADIFKFPWLKFRVDEPTTGSDYLIQLTYRPARILEIYSRFKSEIKSINHGSSDLTMNPVIPQPRQNWRTQFSYKISSTTTLRSRTEIVWYNRKTAEKEQGFLMSADVIFKPLLKKYAGNLRFQYFESDGYNSRIYAFENDLLYSYSIPVFYDKGYRLYINFNCDINKKISLGLKLSRTIYPDKDEIGSGLDLVQNSHRTDIKVQIIAGF